MACVIGFAVIIVAILAALTLFPVIFTFGMSPEQGPGLIFKTLPFLFAKLPGAQVISTVFFTLFVFTALTSAIPFIEVCATNLMELLGWKRKKAALIVASSTFIFGIPSALSYSSELFGSWQTIYGRPFLETIDTLVSTWIIPVGGLLTAIFIGWVFYGRALRAEFPEGRGWDLFYHLWRLTIRWVIPVTILLIILQKSGLIHFDHLFI